jgi:hypothetical protein
LGLLEGLRSGNAAYGYDAAIQAALVGSKTPNDFPMSKAPLIVAPKDIICDLVNFALLVSSLHHNTYKSAVA